jgi:putative tricarboxylic transport membrane protein
MARGIDQFTCGGLTYIEDETAMPAIRMGRLLRGAVGFALFAVAHTSIAQEWKPTQPVMFFAGAAAGGSIDLTARLLSQIFDARNSVGQRLVIINRPGAGNGIAWQAMNERGGDGHAIGIGTTNLVSNPVTGLHPIGWRDVTLIAILFNDSMVQIVRADSPLKSMRDVAERLRADPGVLSIAVAPNLGTGAHTAVASALQASGVRARDARIVVYKSAPEALTALVGGSVDIVSTTPVTAAPFMQNGKVRAIASSGTQRVPGIYANVPTLQEQGIHATFINWRAVIGAKGMRLEHVNFWVEALRAATQTDQWKRDLERSFWTGNFVAGEPLQSFVKAEEERFRTIWDEIGSVK